MITDHSWRPADAAFTRGRPPLAERLCEYMNCRRPRSEHARAVSETTKGRVYPR